jgi:hypothetical protein
VVNNKTTPIVGGAMVNPVMSYSPLHGHSVVIPHPIEDEARLLRAVREVLQQGQAQPTILI